MSAASLRSGGGLLDVRGDGRVPGDGLLGPDGLAVVAVAAASAFGELGDEEQAPAGHVTVKTSGS